MARRAATGTRVRNEADRLYRPSAERPELVDVPELLFLVVDGEGDPNQAAAYREAVESLYAVSYRLKFASKRGGGPDWRVHPLEGLWWMEGQGEGEPPPGAGADPAAPTGDRSRWRWRALIRQPEHLTPAMVADAVDAARSKLPREAAGRLRLEHFHEGLAAQVMHVGPYAAEGPTIERLHAFIAENGLVPMGRHHEIYLGDPRRTTPENLRTIIRQSVRAA